MFCKYITFHYRMNQIRYSNVQSYKTNACMDDVPSKPRNVAMAYM